MEKINKEELMKSLNLTEEELEKVAGGGYSPNCDDVKADFEKDSDYCIKHPFNCMRCNILS